MRVRNIVDSPQQVTVRGTPSVESSFWRVGWGDQAIIDPAVGKASRPVGVLGVDSD